MRKSLVFRGNVQARHPSDFRISQRRHHSAQVVRLHANVTIIDDQDFVPRLIHHAHKLGHFVVDGLAPRSKKNANLPLRKIVFQLFQNRHRRITSIPNAKNQLVLRIVLPAITRQVFVSLGIQPPQRFEVAYRRRETGIRAQTLLHVPEKPPCTEKDKQIIDKRESCEDEKKIAGTLRNHRTPCAKILLRLARSLDGFIANQKDSKNRIISPFSALDKSLISSKMKQSYFLGTEPTLRAGAQLKSHERFSRSAPENLHFSSLYCSVCPAR